MHGLSQLAGDTQLVRGDGEKVLVAKARAKPGATFPKPYGQVVIGKQPVSALPAYGIACVGQLDGQQLAQQWRAPTHQLSDGEL